MFWKIQDLTTQNVHYITIDKLIKLESVTKTCIFLLNLSKIVPQKACH